MKEKWQLTWMRLRFNFDDIYFLMLNLYNNRSRVTHFCVTQTPLHQAKQVSFNRNNPPCDVGSTSGGKIVIGAEGSKLDIFVCVSPGYTTSTSEVRIVLSVVYLLAPCRPRYVSTGFFCEKEKKIDNFSIAPLY